MGEAVIDLLRRRMAESAEGLAPVDADARADLDAAVSAVVRDWIDDHGLLPPARVEQISEHALPLVAHVRDDRVPEAEVSQIGTYG